MTTFEVDRTSWLRGEGGHQSYLRRKHDGRQCCLGFMCKALGLTDAEITGLQTPEQASRVEEACVGLRTIVARDRSERDKGPRSPFDRAMAVNDDINIDEPKRERGIIEALAQLDLDVVFV